MSFLYNLVFLLYSLVYFPYLICTKRWHRDYLQRFGVFPEAARAQLHQDRNVWVHAVSVGEVNAVESFIRLLKEKRPGINIVCTVTTKTGYELARQRLKGVALVIASPLDLTWVVDGFIRRIRPVLYIAAETEIWPNLFGALHKKGVPIAIINGRISDRSLGRYKYIKGLLENVLAKVRVFAMQSDLDAQRIIELGAPKQSVHVTGNIKFDDIPPENGERMDANFASRRLLWIAGSTAPGEEELLLEVFKKLTGAHPAWQLVLAPRHIERAKEVMNLVGRRGFKAEAFSEMEGGQAQAESVIVVDTIGHLRRLYAYASLVFIGKSLCVGGGQNVIEPAYFAKPIITGPKMENFRDIVACFKADGALVQVEDAAQLETAVADLMKDEVRRLDLGQRARRVIDKNRGAQVRTLRLIEQWL